MLLLQYLICSCVHLVKSLQTSSTKSQEYHGDPDKGRQHLRPDAHRDSGNPDWQWENAPVICLIPAFIVLAVIPIGPTITIFGKQITLYVTDLNIGVLYVLSISSVGVLGIILGGRKSG